MDSITLIGHPSVRNIIPIESDERMVDLLAYSPSLRIDLTRLNVNKLSPCVSLTRLSVADKLVKAQSLLPTGVNLLIKECYRPMFVQKVFWDSYFAHLKEKYPLWNDQQVYDECSKLNAPLDVAPHCTGGAVDLTLADDSGNWLDMGTDFNAEPIETEYATYTEALNISEKARLNRRLLADVMSDVGFVNYPTEWWHWSYGDKYWAFMNKLQHSIYDVIAID